MTGSCRVHSCLGPYGEGRYTALLANGLQAGEIQRRDGLYLPGAAGVQVRIRYQSPEGWTTSLQNSRSTSCVSPG